MPDRPPTPFPDDDVFEVVFGIRSGRRLRGGLGGLSKLKLTVEPETEAIVVKGEGARGVSSAYMHLYAEPGRDKAQDVEMFVSLGTTIEAVEESPVIGIMRDVNMNFEGGRLGGGEGDTVTSVLPGMVRQVPLMMFGEGQALYDVLPKVEGDWLPEHFDDDFCAFLHTFPARQDRIDRIKARAAYSIFLVIAGTNFDATAYAGNFSVDGVDMACADEPGLENVVSIKLDWTKPLPPHVGPPNWVLTDKM